MGTFGLFFYGPYQHWWYGLLNRRWPLRTASHFLTKVRADYKSVSKAADCYINVMGLLPASDIAGDFESGGSWTCSDYCGFHMESLAATEIFRNTRKAEARSCANYGQWYDHFAVTFDYY